MPKPAGLALMTVNKALVKGFDHSCHYPLKVSRKEAREKYIDFLGLAGIMSAGFFGIPRSTRQDLVR